ncbi:hypothetical protein [Actinokineospora sp.]|uniref:hypothetical protein n=1 Tax=Actinokineospora sp. TaxID=1872133 RepID=UPI0040380BDA
MKAQTVRNRSRFAVSGAFSAILLVVTAESAAAQTSVESSIPFTLDGPVGIAAVILGAGGLVIGLFRHRRPAAAAEVPPVELEEPTEVVLPHPRQPAPQHDHS